MAGDRGGYLGRNPGDSNVTIAKQVHHVTSAGTTFAFTAGYTPGYMDVYLNGVRLINITDYTANSGSNVVLTSQALVGDVLELVAYKALNAGFVDTASGDFSVGEDLTVTGNLSVTGVSTLGTGSSVSFATTSYKLAQGQWINLDTTESTNTSNGALIVYGGVGIAKSLNVGGNVTVGGTLTYEDLTNQDVLGIATYRGGVQFGVAGVGGTIRANGDTTLVGVVTAGSFVGNITGDVNAPAFDTNAAGVVVTGITTSSITALDAISEQLVRVDGNTATITYNSGGANIGYCTNPTGDITLSVTGIPTSSFDNQALTFSLIVDNSTANAAGVRTCNAVKLNNVTKTIRWSGGSVGTGNTMSYDIFNFTGINTIGSGTTTTNYEVFGLVNGDFRLY